MSNNATKGFTPKGGAQSGDERYKTDVAEPIMRAIDDMPRPFRDLIKRFGYIDIYRAWRAGWTVERINAKAVGDWFEL